MTVQEIVMGQKLKKDMKGVSSNRDLKKELRGSISRCRTILNVNQTLQASLDVKTAEAERCQVIILAYNAEMNRLGERITELAVLLEMPFEQCTGERYEHIQRLHNDLHVRFALINGADRPSSGTSSLSRRERRILGLIDQGLSSKEIAVKLSLSEHTIKTHRKNIRRKQKA
jgi:DNA-binding CsgD family transcriptional regulator